MKRSSILKLFLVALALTAALCLTACFGGGGGEGGGSTSHIGTYYLFDDGATDTSSWVKLTEKGWSDSDGVSGTYELSNGNIVFYVSFGGEQTEYIDGTLVDDKLTVGAAGIEITYYLDGKAPAQGPNGGGNGGGGNGDGGEGDPDDIETLLADFEYERDGDNITVTGIKNSNAKTIVVPDCVTAIAECAFEDCGRVESLTIPFIGLSRDDETGNIALIFQKKEYQYGGGITVGPSQRPTHYYKAPDTITSITVTGDVKVAAASSVPSVKHVTFLGSAERLAESAFGGCTQLTSLVLPRGITAIEDQAFAECTNLKTMTLSDSITAIGDMAFYGCSQLTEITLPANLTELGYSAFSGCGLTSIRVPGGVATVPSSAFADCPLTEVVVENGVLSIEGGAFCGSATLTKIELPNSVTKIESGAFGDCADSATTVYEGVRYIGTPNRPYYLCLGPSDKTITAVTFPTGVKIIEPLAFLDCTALQSISLPSGVEMIGSSAFYRCTSLVSVRIPNSVTAIGAGVFGQCVALEEISMPMVGGSVYNRGTLGIYFDRIENSEMVEVRQYELDYNDREQYSYYYLPANLHTVELYVTDEELPASMFYYCTMLKKVVIHSETLKSVGADAFGWCTALTEVTLPGTVTSLGDFSFGRCEALQLLCFDGTQAAWNAVEKYGRFNSKWNSFTATFTVRCDDGDITVG